MDSPSIRTITTMCAQDCPDACFLDVLVQNGEILKVKASFENTVTSGIICYINPLT